MSTEHKPEPIRVELRVGTDGRIWLNVDDMCVYRAPPLTENDRRPIVATVINERPPAPPNL